MTLADTLQRVTAMLPTTYAHVFGPPFRVPPAAPCLIIELPQITAVIGCHVADARVDVVCVPQTGTDYDHLVTMADEVIGTAGGAVIGGQPEPNPYTDVDDIWTYRLTLEL